MKSSQKVQIRFHFPFDDLKEKLVDVHTLKLHFFVVFETNIRGRPTKIALLERVR